MRKLLAIVFLFSSMLACKPPITELQLPTISTMQSKSYQELIYLTELKTTPGNETIDAYLIIPEMVMINTEEKFRTDGKLDQLEVYKKKTFGDDTVICLVRFLAASKDNVDPNKWTFALTDDTGQSASGKVESGTSLKQVKSERGKPTFYQDGQITFDGYQIGDAKKISIQISRPGTNATTLTWLMPTDRTPQTPPSSKPTSSLLKTQNPTCPTPNCAKG
jgi:hypothetical protein